MKTEVDLNNASYIDLEDNVPEISVKAFILSIFLTILLTSSTLYLGLKVGITISASIPAAVISLGVLGLFRQHNILESNAVQTAASSGMSLATGIIFCLPALLILKIWDNFHFMETMLITTYAGVLGVLFSVPFRKLLLRDKSLHFPEGTAIGYILQAKGQQGKSLGLMIWGGVAGALITLAQNGLKIFAETVGIWCKVGKTITGVSLGFSPVLVGAGYIIGGETAFTIFIGIILAWGIGLPWVGLEYGLPETSNLMQMAMLLWSKYIRYIGVGVLLVGSLHVFFKLLCSIWGKCTAVVKDQVTNDGENKTGKTANKIKCRTERDLPMPVVIIGTLLLVVPIYFAYKNIADINTFGMSEFGFCRFNMTLVFYTLVVGLIFSVVCGYIVGMVGSSASPLSALSLATIIFGSLIILSFLGGQFAFYGNPEKAKAAASLSIIMGLVVTCSGAIMNDTIQDLKVGDMIGATPWKLEVMQIVGVLIAAVISPLVLDLLFEAYGLGGVFPRPGMDPTASLAAPQAQLMASITEAIFKQDMPWTLIIIGVVIAIGAIIADIVLKKIGKGSISVIAIGIGIYLPMYVSSALVLGGLISYLSERNLRKNKLEVKPHMQKGFLFASGLISGGALLGIILAIPFVLMQDTNALAIVGSEISALTTSLGIIAAAALFYSMYKIGTVKTKNS